MPDPKIRFDILSLFPEFFKSPLSSSLISKAIKKGLIEVKTHDIRDFGTGKHKQVDDRPFGGGPGMVLKADVLANSLQDTIATGKKTRKGAKPHVILLDPTGKQYNQKKVRKLSKMGWVILICGHYEGVDERFKELFVGEEISIGDYIVSGGETASLVLIDSIARLIPGFLGKEESTVRESFSTTKVGVRDVKLLDYPDYTRPKEFAGKKIPEVLLSGDHVKIRNWRLKKQIEKTKSRRPDLLKTNFST